MSKLVETRAEFQRLSEVRREEAKVLLDAKRWDGAYYLVGYAMEVALKACIIKTVMAKDAFQEKKFSEKCWTHVIGDLIDLADLRAAWNTATAADPVLSGNWGIAKVWTEQKRYHLIPEAEAVAMYEAVAEPTHGVLTWIRTQW